MKKTFVSVCILLSAAWLRPAHATASMPWIAGTLAAGGTSSQVVVSGHYAYLADGSAGLHIVDIQNPASPTLVGTYDTLGTAEDVAIGPHNAYVADGANGVVVVNIDTPSNPFVVTTIPVTGTAHGITWFNGWVFVAMGSAGLADIDASTPTAPVLKTSVDTDGDAHDVWTNGDDIFVADGANGIVIFGFSDINDPPTYVGRTATAGPTIGLDEEVPYPDGTPYLYVAEQTAGIETFSFNYITKVLTHTNQLTTTGSVTSVSHFSLNDLGDRHYLHVASGSGGAQIYDVTKETSQRLIASFPVGSDTYGVFATQSYSYVASGTGGLAIVTLSPLDPIAPVISLNGSTAVTVAFGADYIDAGATATDNVDGNLTAALQTTLPASYVSSTHRFLGSGTFTVTYSVSDAAGNVTTATRTITVTPPPDPAIAVVYPPETHTNPNGTPAVSIINGPAKTDVNPLGSTYKGKYFAQQISFGKTTYNILIPTSAQSTGKILFLYGTNNKLIYISKIETALTKKGLTPYLFITTDKKTVFITILPKANSKYISVYALTAKGIKTLPRLLVSTKAAHVIAAYPTLYKKGGHAIVTAVYKKQATIKVWVFNAKKNKFIEDTGYNKKKLVLKGETIKLK